MRSNRIVVLTAWLAGSCDAPTTPTTPTPRPTPTTFEEHATRIDELAERGCACADRRCLADVDRELAEMVAGVPLTAVDEKVLETRLPQAEKSLERLSVCMTDRELASTSYGPALLARVQEVRDAMCECATEACTQGLYAALMPELATVDSFPVEASAWVAMQALSTETRSCAERFAVPALAVAELEELRDSACACGDAACAAKVQAEFEAFLERHRDTQGSDADAEKIAQLAGQMSECLGAAAGR